MSQFWKRYRLVIAFVAVIVAINVTFLFYSPRALVAAIGVENSYLVIFLIAALGGLSSFTSGIYYAAVATFSAGGATPWLLGIVGGLGLAVSDTIFYLLAKMSTDSAGLSDTPGVRNIVRKIHTLPRGVQYLFIYIYLGLTPLPNDILMVSLAILGFRYRTIIWFILAGGITLTTIAAYLGNIWQ